MRNVFVSYSHRLDQNDADDFRKRFGSNFGYGGMTFSDYSLQNNDLSDLTDDTIKNDYIRPRIRKSSVTIVLIGAETGGRWWCDWEIYYSLLKTAGNGRNGLIGILLPNKQHFIPARLQDNVKTGYAKIIEYPHRSSDLKDELNDAAFRSGLIDPDLSRPLRQRNSHVY